MAKDFHWPNGKRIAVGVTVMLETWSEGKAPPYVQASPLKAGLVDHAGIAWGSYGGKVGVWRIINLLEPQRHHGHVLRQRTLRRDLPGRGRADRQVRARRRRATPICRIRCSSPCRPRRSSPRSSKCLDLLEKVSGMRPQGWISPMHGLHRAHARLPRRRRPAVARRRARHRPARRGRDQKRPDRSHPGQRLHRQPRAASRARSTCGTSTRRRSTISICASRRIAIWRCPCIATSAAGR